MGCTAFGDYVIEELGPFGFNQFSLAMGFTADIQFPTLADTILRFNQLSLVMGCTALKYLI